MEQHSVCKLLLVDDNSFNREGMGIYLQTKGFSILEAGDLATAWHIARQEEPKVAIIDIVIPASVDAEVSRDASLGIQLAQQLKKVYPFMGVVLLSAYENHGREFFDMVRSGICGLAYKLKGCKPSALLEAIYAVQAGQVIIDPEITTFCLPTVNLLELLNLDERLWVEKTLQHLSELTPREREVAYLMAASHNTESIASKICVTPKTVENYITRIYKKLGLNDMSEDAPHLRKAVILAKAFMFYELRTEQQNRE